jgi:hypothetical protein
MLYGYVCSLFVCVGDLVALIRALDGCTAIIGVRRWIWFICIPRRPSGVSWRLYGFVWAKQARAVMHRCVHIYVQLFVSASV